MTEQNSAISFKLPKPGKMGKVAYWLNLRKRLPEESEPVKGVISNRHRMVDDSDWKVGDEYLTEFGQRCTVIKVESVFMGFSALVQYSNGALRWNSYSDFLYSVDPKVEALPSTPSA